MSSLGRTISVGVLTAIGALIVAVLPWRAATAAIINAHGGRMWASANSERGLVVHIELPRFKEPRSDARSSVAVADPLAQ